MIKIINNPCIEQLRSRLTFIINQGNLTILVSLLIFLMVLIDLFSMTYWWVFIGAALIIDIVRFFHSKNYDDENQQPKFSEKNKSIADEIDEFIDNPLSNNFALLINGKWGSGKTTFILDYLKTKENFVYVSLFGISSTEQLQSTLSEKFYIHKYRLAKYPNVINIIKKIIYFISRNDPYNLLSLPNKCIVVFDDLERCDDINIKQLLGFINRYSEHSKHSVIIIVNEEEINQKELENFIKIKEKLVIKECVIESDFDLVFKSFIQEFVANKNLKELLRKDEVHDRIKMIFIRSKYNNLRLLKTFLYELNITLNKIEIQSFHNEFFYNFIQIYFALYIETKLGKVSTEDINSYKAYYPIGEDEPEIATKLRSYGLSSLSEETENTFLLPNEFWIKILFNKKLDEQIFLYQFNLCKKNLNSNKYISVCLNIIRLNDLLEDDFLFNLKMVEQYLDDNKYKEIDIIKHLAGVFITLNKNNIFPHEKYKVPDFFIGYIKKNKLIDCTLFNMPLDELDILTDSSFGFEYWNHNKPEFKKLLEFINTEKTNKEIDFLKQEALTIEKDLKLFSNKIYLNKKYNNYYFYNKPILQHINIENFLSNLANLTGRQIHSILSTIIERRKDLDNTTSLKSKEIEWTNNLFIEIKRLANGDNSNLSTFNKLKFNNILSIIEQKYILDIEMK